MDKQVKLAEIYDVMVEMLESGGTVNFNPNGTSMLPTISNHGDRVVIKKPMRRLKKYELPLYRRSDGSFVLHRVVRVYDDSYGMCGDNQWVIEKSVKDSQIVGLVTEIYRKGRKIDVNKSLFYKIYIFIWVNIMPLRHIFFGGLNRIKKIVKRFM
ncbi:MAG: S24/S26 family peptidase [Lachnospirales bacterium]